MPHRPLRRPKNLPDGRTVPSATMGFGARSLRSRTGSYRTRRIGVILRKARARSCPDAPPPVAPTEESAGWAHDPVGYDWCGARSPRRRFSGRRHRLPRVPDGLARRLPRNDTDRRPFLRIRDDAAGGKMVPPYVRGAANRWNMLNCAKRVAWMPCESSLPQSARPGENAAECCGSGAETPS
jgi:hypothetical protein